MSESVASASARFRGIYEANFRSLLGYALRRVEAAADAADVVAETFLVAWRRLEDVPRGDEARLWLFGVARRVLANHQRGATRRGRLAARLQEELAYQVRFTQPTSDGSTARVHEVLLRLDDEDRELLTLTAWEGLSPSELAVIWSMPAPTVRTRLHRARQRFRAEYEALGRDGDERNGRTGHVAGEVQMLV